MNRRTVLAGLGSLTAGGLAVGSGAFTSVNAERSVSVATSRDSDAYLELVPIGRGFRSATDGPELEFNIPGLGETGDDGYNEQDPEGVGVDSVYRFGRDGQADEPGLFEIRNQGTQPVRVWTTQPQLENGEPKVDIYNVENGEVLTEDDRSRLVEVGGEPILGGLRIDTHGVDPGKRFEVVIRINAAVERE
jgi:hypothetical protein